MQAGAVALLGAPHPQHRGRAARPTRPCARRWPTRSTGSRWSRCCSTAPCPVLQSVLRPGPARVRAGLRGLRVRPGARALAADGRGLDPRRRRDLREGRHGSWRSRSSSPPASELRRTTVRLMADQAERAGIRLTARPSTPDTLFGSDLGAGRLHGGDARLRRAASSPARHRPPRLGSDPDGGERVHRPERVPVEQPRRRPPDAPLRPAGRRRRPRAGPRAHPGDRGRPGARSSRSTSSRTPSPTPRPSQGVRENPSQAEVFWNSAEWSLGGGSDSP